MTSTTVDYSWAMLGFLKGKVEGLVAALNADLAENVPGVPAFETMLGIPANVTGPTLAYDYKSDLPPRRAASGEKVIGLQFIILCLLPSAGSSRADDFAVCRARARDFLTTLFDDDAEVLLPRIDAGLIGDCSAMEAERGAITDLFGMEMEDKVTRVRGWQMTYNVWFSLTSA